MAARPDTTVQAPKDAAGKFQHEGPAGLSQEGSKATQATKPSRLFSLIDDLDRLSAELRHFVAGFETFRNAKEKCDELYDVVVSPARDYQHWDRISELLEKMAPTTLRPSASDEDWVEDVAAPMKRFEKGRGTVRKRVERYLKEGGSGDGVGVDQADVDSVRADARAMRAAVRDALETYGRRADWLAEQVRTCAEKISMLVPRETTGMESESAASLEPKQRDVASSSLDQTVTFKDIKRAADQATQGRGGD